MNFNQKKQVIDLLKTVESAISYAKNNINQSELLIGDSLQALISILNFLNENQEDYDTQSIEELINKLKNFSSISFSNRKKELNLYSSQIKNILKSIEELDIKLKAVFLPYKASMWTSLESIWKAADKDPDCEATVMPIPYHDIDSNGIKVNICYEGEKYPEYVPVKKFWEYNIKKENPDMIFIHNPFDDRNKLTRVPDEYYSRNLKNEYNKLVYVPYHATFIYNDAKDKPLIDAYMDTFNYMDKIIVENNDVKEKYEEREGNIGKILPLGSPKLDAIYEVRECGIKEKNKFKGIAANKKIFLLITTLSYYSRIRREAFEVIMRVYEEVTKNKDCILIWRPHPLEENWIKNHIESIYPLYKDIRTLFENSENVIIDLKESYLDTLYSADGIICCSTSLISEAMAMAKPLYLIEDHFSSNLPQYLNVHFLFDHALYYDTFNKNISEYIEDVISGKEEKLYSKRLELIQDDVNNFKHGNSGEKIYETIKNEVLNKK